MPGASKDLHTVFVRNLPYDFTSKQLKELFQSKLGENSVKLATVVMDSEKGESKGYGFVELKLISDANKAPKELNGTEIQSRKLMVKPFLLKSQQKEEKEKKATLVYDVVVRNLNPSIKIETMDEILHDTFKGIGVVTNVRIPCSKKSKKTHNGYAFVTFQKPKHAQRAVEYFNGKTIQKHKTPIIVDLKMEKEEFLKQKQAVISELKNKKEEKREEESDEEEEEEILKSVPKPSEMDDDTSSDESIDLDEYARKMDFGDDFKIVGEKGDDKKEEDSDEESEESEESEDEEKKDEDEEKEKDSEEDKEDDSKKKKKEHTYETMYDRTLFISNLPPSATEKSVQKCFSSFGDIVYVAIVKDKSTGAAKGTAFLQFKDRKSIYNLFRRVDAEAKIKSLEKAELNVKSEVLPSTKAKHLEDIKLDGRILLFSLAERKEEVEQKKKDRESETKDKRHLYLSKEGYFDFESVVKKELADQFTKYFKNKLKLLQTNTNFHISQTRIIIHNLPKGLKPAELKSILIKAATVEGEEKPKITSLTLGKDTDKNTLLKFSRKYAFATFSKHESALRAVRQLSGKKGVIPGFMKHVLFVEFAMDNKLKQYKAKMYSEYNKSLTDKATNPFKTPSKPNEQQTSKKRKLPTDKEVPKAKKQKTE